MIHPSSDVQTTEIGEGTTIWQYCVVLPRARIGRNCNINCGVFIENDVIVGDNVTVKCGVQLWDGMRVGNGVFVGPNVTFTNDMLPRSKRYPEAFLNTVIMEGASIGANATIVGGVTIGAYAMIGAGSVLTKDVPAHALWYGNPARGMGYICSCGSKLSVDMVCGRCEKKYHEADDGVVEI